jgi:hypothetical protein
MLGRDDSSTQDTQDVAARDLPYVGLRTADIQEGLSNSYDLARVKARGCRTVEVRAKPDVINADEIADIGNGSRRVLRISGADCPFPIANADHAAGLGNTGDFLVGQVAIDLACRLDAAMAEDDRARGHCQYVGNCRMTGVRQIDDYSQSLHPAHDLVAERCQPAFSDTMHGARDVIVEEVRKASHSEAGGVEHIQIGDIALEVLQAFDRQHAANHRIPLFFDRQAGDRCPMEH